MADYYVATTGSDAAAGTIGAPWLTPSYALSVGSATVAGDTIYMRAGTYPSVDTQTYPATSGTSWANVLTLSAYQSEAVHMNGIGVYAESYLVFMDLILDGLPNGQYGETIGLGAGATQGTGAGHIRFVNCDVHGNNSVPIPAGIASIVNVSDGSSGFNEFIGGRVHDIGTGPGDSIHGIYVSSPNNIVDGVEIYNISDFGIHNFYGPVNNNTYKNCYIHHTGVTAKTNFGIGIYTGTGNRVFNNVLTNNRNGIDIGASSTDTDVDNNTVHGCTDSGPFRYPAIICSGGSGHAIRNNIVFGNVDNSINTSGATAPTVSNNLLTDPSFVNAAGGDFHLQTGSAAKDAGTTLAGVPTDREGVARPQGAAYDIGAYEFSGGVVVSLPVGSLGVTGRAQTVSTGGVTALIASVAAGSTNTNDVTTGAIDTTGANFLVAVVAGHYAVGDVVVTDSKGNTWIPLTRSSTASGVSTQLVYVVNSTVGSNHTFTGTRSGAYPSIAVAAFSGRATVSPFDVENGSIASSTSHTIGSITPSESNELIIAGLGISGGSSSPVINAGLTITNTVLLEPAQHYFVSLAYYEQGAASAINPQWSWTDTNASAARIAAFKPAPLIAVPLGVLAVTGRAPSVSISGSVNDARVVICRA